MTTALSNADICNLALDYLLQSNDETVTNVNNPTTSTEVICNRWYDVTRRSVLRKHPWLFARKRQVLTSVVGSPPFGYNNAYNLPNDYLRLVSIQDPNTFEPYNKTVYTIESGQILTNPTQGTTPSTAASLNLVYIYDFTNVSKMDALFIEVLAMELALNMSYKFTSSNSDVQRLDSLLRDKLQSARSVNGQERPPIRIERSNASLSRRLLGNNQTTTVNPWS